MRTFIALDLGSEVKASLGRLISRLSSLTRNVRWVKPEGMHLTLKFLGEIGEEQAGRVSAVLDELARRHGRISFSVRGTGWFPERSRSPRVLWAGMETGPELSSLHVDLDRDLSRLGFPADKRAFHPHLTLGRVGDPRGLQPVLRELESLSTAEFGGQTAADIIFFQSRLKPGGAEYSVLRSFPLT